MSNKQPESSSPEMRTVTTAEGSFQQRLVQLLQTQSLAQILVGQLRRLLRFLILLYAASLILLWLGLSRVGEHNLTTAFLLYLPPAGWFLPFPVLLAGALILNRKGALLLIAVLSFLALFWLQFRVSGPEWSPQPTANSLTLLTYNRGQQGSQSLQPFKNAVQPDAMVLQDAGSRAEGYLNSPGYAEFKDARSAGEHTLVSRHPILEAELLKEPHPGPRAARFVIDWNGTQVAIYSVHLHTPRGVLQSQYRGGFLYGILGLPGTPWEARKEKEQRFWKGQLADADALVEAVRAEPLPCLIAGDFNAPNLGALYRRLALEWTDAHAAAGQGLGFTFPGTTRNPLSGGGPWMRIDYIFAAHGWEVESCRTEPDRTSQHRALAARLRRLPRSEARLETLPQGTMKTP